MTHKPDVCSEPALHADGFPLPRLESAERPGTSHDLADRALAWIDKHAPGDPLMPWQRYVVRRMLETDGQGRLWRTCVLLVGRQLGKTYVMRRLLLWRAVACPEIFAAPQWVLSTAPSYQQAQDLMEPWARELRETMGGTLRMWTNAGDWWLDGNERGSSWRIRALRRAAITGTSATCVFCDEVQDVPPEVMRRALVPTTSSPRIAHAQLLFAGTGAKSGPAYVQSRESLVLRELRQQALEGGDVLLLEWSAPPEAAVDDRVGWRWASPDWSPWRERTLVAESTTPGFATEYLVQHEEPGGAADLPGEPLLDEARWLECRLRGLRAPVLASCAVGVVEDNFGRGGACALAWRDADGVPCVWADERPLAQCWQQVAGVPRVVCGKSLEATPDAVAVGAVGVGSRETGSAMSVLRRLVDEGGMRWDGGPQLVEAASLRVGRNAGNVLAAKPGQSFTATKCAMWALNELVNTPLDVPAIY